MINIYVVLTEMHIEIMQMGMKLYIRNLINQLRRMIKV